MWPLTGSFSNLNGIVIDGIITQSYRAFYGSFTLGQLLMQLQLFVLLA
jgi:hypothetical protein